MDAFKKLRKMYNDAGVTIYAWKQLNPNMSDEEFDYVFNVAEALGCTHTTLELPTDAAQLKRIGDFAMKHEDLRGVPHAPAGQHDRIRSGVRRVERQYGEHRLRSLRRGRQRRWHADAVPAEVPRPDLELPPEGSNDARSTAALNLAWGTGDTPIKEILQLVSKNKWKIPARSSSNTTSPRARTPSRKSASAWSSAGRRSPRLQARRAAERRLRRGGARPSRFNSCGLAYYPAARLRCPRASSRCIHAKDVLGVALAHHERSRPTHRSVNCLSTLLPHRPTAFGRRAVDPPDHRHDR